MLAVIRLDYVPYMKEILLKKLLSGEDVRSARFVLQSKSAESNGLLYQQNIQEVIELLDECEITREDLTESMESFKFPGVKRHSYSELDTKAKTAFTRMYAASMHLTMVAVKCSLEVC